MLTVFPQYLNVGAVALITSLPPVLVQNIFGTGIRMTWTITKTNTKGSDTGILKIYNLSRANIEALKAIYLGAFAYTCTFSFGWSGIMGLALTGEIFKITADEHDGTNIISTIEFGEKVISIRDAIPTGIQAAQMLWLSAFQSIAAQMGCILSPQFITALNANPVALSTPTINAVFNNDPKRDLDVLVNSMGPGYNWSIQNGQLFLLNSGIFSDITPPHILQPSTGLLSYSLIEGGGIQAEALGHPDLRPGQQLLMFDKFQIPIGGGPLRIESITWNGDTNTGCKMTVIARSPSIFVGA